MTTNLTICKFIIVRVFLLVSVFIFSIKICKYFYSSQKFCMNFDISVFHRVLNIKKTEKYYLLNLKKYLQGKAIWNLVSISRTFLTFFQTKMCNKACHKRIKKLFSLILNVDHSLYSIKTKVSFVG